MLSQYALSYRVGKTIAHHDLQAFYLPNKDKQNFRVLCDALVHRIVTEEKDGNVVAVGVQFEHGGNVHTVNTKKEVIVSAG